MRYTYFISFAGMSGGDMRIGNKTYELDKMIEGGDEIARIEQDIFEDMKRYGAVIDKRPAIISFQLIKTEVN